MAGEIKQFMYVNRRAPYGTIYALESLEVVLIGAAFDQDVSLAFIDDGVFQLTKDHQSGKYNAPDSQHINMKSLAPTYRALGDFDVKKLYVEKESLEMRGLTADDLQDIKYEDEDDDYAEKDCVHIVSRAEMVKLMAQQDVLLNF